MKMPPPPRTPATTTSRSRPCATSPAAGRPPSRPNSTAPPATAPRSALIAFSTFPPTPPLWPPALSKPPPPGPQNVDITVFVSGLNPADILRYKRTLRLTPPPLLTLARYAGRGQGEGFCLYSVFPPMVLTTLKEEPKKSEVGTYFVA